MSHIVCIRPPLVFSRLSTLGSITPPLAAAYLCGTLRANGYSVQALDAVGEDVDRVVPIPGTAGLAQGLLIDDIVDKIDSEAEIIGFSTMFSCGWTQDRRLIQRVRQRFPKAFLLAGGEHITAAPEYSLRDCPELDLCALGEGEATFLDIVDACSSGRDPSVVNGVAARKNGEFYKTAARARIRHIDDIPEPDWGGLPIAVYLDRGFSFGVNRGRSMPLLASRGCPFQCTFCSSPAMWTTRWEARSPHKVLEEMRKYISQYRADNFDLYDLTAIVRRDWIIEFCDLILESGLRFTWQIPGGTRSEAIDEVVVDKLWLTGCHNVTYAPESGSPSVLKRVKKQVQLPKMEKSIKAAIDRGIKVRTNMVFAFPEDTPFEIWESLVFGARCAWWGVNDSGFAPYQPYPGSEIYRQLREENRIEPMSDDYFNGLIASWDLPNSKSYNPRFRDWQLIAIRLCYLLLFYGIAFARRPWRFATILINSFRGKEESRLETTVRHLLFRRRSVAKASNGGL